MNFDIPDDFESIVALDILGIPAATAIGEDIDLFSTYSGGGEPYNQHEESDTIITFDTVANQINAFDILSVFSEIEPNDICGIQVDHNSISGKVDYLGVRMIYRV